MNNPKIFNRLNFKVIFSVILCLGVIGTIFFYILYSFHKNQLIESLKESTNNLSRLIAVGLEQEMLKGDRGLVQTMVDDLSRRKGVEQILIVNKKGVIKIASKKNLEGVLIDKKHESCQICHKFEARNRSRTIIFKLWDGRTVFRNVNPILNNPKCYKCHNPKDKINGVLIMDFSMDGINKQLASNIREMSMWAALMTFGLILIIALLMNRLVLKRISSFIKAVKLMGDGNLDVRAEVKGGDEIAELSFHFNRMAQGLKESMEKINQDKEFLENMINSIDDGVIVVDKDYKIILANNSFISNLNLKREKVLGEVYNDVLKLVAFTPLESPAIYGGDGIGKISIPYRKEGVKSPSFLTGFTKDSSYFTEQLEKAFRAEESIKVQNAVIDQDGKEKYFEIHSSLIKDKEGEVAFLIEVWRDITERKEFEEKLSHSERLVSLGILASGMAHEINNPLASITACIEGLQRRVRENPDIFKGSLGDFPEYLGLVHKETNRCKSTVEKLLSLSQKRRLKISPVDINKLVLETIALLSYEISKKNIEVIKELSDDIPLIHADEQQISQVFLNLELNAIQAIDEKGTIKIVTKRDDPYVKILFEDTGCGIDKENLNKIFEPFYTNKPPNKGTGLGLAICNGIIKQHNGEISVESVKGKGTRFTVSLPFEKG